MASEELGFLHRNKDRIIKCWREHIIYNVNIAALAEVMPLAVKAGLEPRKLEEVLTTASARSGCGTSARGPR